MPATEKINIDALLAEVTRAKNVKDSVVAFVSGISQKIQDAVTTALTADNAADDASIKAANDAIAATVTDLIANDDAIAAAVVATPAEPGTGGTGTDPNVP